MDTQRFPSAKGVEEISPTLKRSLYEVTDRALKQLGDLATDYHRIADDFGLSGSSCDVEMASWCATLAEDIRQLRWNVNQVPQSMEMHQESQAGNQPRQLNVRVNPYMIAAVCFMVIAALIWFMA